MYFPGLPPQRTKGDLLCRRRWNCIGHSLSTGDTWLYLLPESSQIRVFGKQLPAVPQPQQRPLKNSNLHCKWLRQPNEDQYEVQGKQCQLGTIKHYHNLRVPTHKSLNEIHICWRMRKIFFVISKGSFGIYTKQLWLTLKYTAFIQRGNFKTSEI